MGGFMNNNFYDIPVDWYKEFNKTFVSSSDMNNNIIDSNMNNNMESASLANLKDAFERGNLFNDLYDPYKNYRYRELRANNKREELLFDLLKYGFAMKELNLYLDTHPYDSSMISLYNRYLKEEKKLTNEYEKMYGPLTLDSMYLEGNNWKWNNSPWPWEGTK